MSRLPSLGGQFKLLTFKEFLFFIFQFYCLDVYDNDMQLDALYAACVHVPGRVSSWWMSDERWSGERIAV
jgi:hypothetical protein